MTDQGETCGRELAAGAEIPAKIAALFSHVALNLALHESLVEQRTELGKRERDVLLAVRTEYQALSASAQRAAALLRSAQDLPNAEHDPSALDLETLAEWLKVKVRLQRELAQLLSMHADESELAASLLGRPEGGGPT